MTDNEDATTEDTNADFEGAALKVKSGSSLTISDGGTLNVYDNAKNGIKGSSESSLKVNGGTINVNAKSNGIAFDGSVVINAGSLKEKTEVNLTMQNLHLRQRHKILLMQQSREHKRLEQLLN